MDLGTRLKGKSRLPPGFELRTVQPLAILYADYATAAIFVRRMW
jgi:hypothetical protein